MARRREQRGREGGSLPPLRRARVRAGEPSKPGLGRASTNAQPLPQCGQPGKGQRRGGQGAPRRSGHRRPRGRWMQGRAVRHLWGRAQDSKGQTALAGVSGWSISGPAKSPALPRCLPSPARSFFLTGPAHSARGGGGRAPGCGRRSEEGRQDSRGRRRQSQGRPVATAPGPARGHQVSGGVGPSSARAPQRAEIQGRQQEGFVQGLLRPQAGQDRLHERPGMLVRRPLAAVSTTNPGRRELLHTQLPVKPPRTKPAPPPAGRLLSDPLDLSASQPDHLGTRLSVCARQFVPNTIYHPILQMEKVRDKVVRELWQVQKWLSMDGPTWLPLEKQRQLGGGGVWSHPPQGHKATSNTDPSSPAGGIEG